ncbi:MAG: UbiH/UbiF family hydroxylase [Rhizobiaceae bacterium]
MAIEVKSAPFEICVVGGGLIGLVAALQLAQSRQGQNSKIALVAPMGDSADKRTTAMLMPSIEMLRGLDLWQAIEPKTAALKTMRLIDGSRRLVRAPVTDFQSSELGLDAFGFNVPNEDMLDALNSAIDDHEGIVRFSEPANIITANAENVQIELKSGETLQCKLVVAADGSESSCRAAAGIDVRQWSYPQTAIVLNFTHSLPHGGVSAEFHTETGPFTQVPLPSTKSSQNRSSLVWLVEPQRANELLQMNLGDLSDLIEDKLQSCYGKCFIERQPAAIPMKGMTAHRFAANRIALVGEAGHVFPPIGAQGFNLGLRDIRSLTVALALNPEDPGAAEGLSSYNGDRRRDVNSRTIGVDLMNRSLLTDFLPVQLVRTAGLSALGSVSLLRKIAMLQGLGMERHVGGLFTAPGKDLLAKFRSQSGTEAR